MGWNGYDLRAEYSAHLSDTSSSYMARVLIWMNDIQRDICSRHDWGFLLKKGKKVLASGTENPSLIMSSPPTPTIALAAGGSLVNGSTYKIVVTYVDSNGCESQPSSESNEIVASSGNGTLNVTVLTVSAEPLVSSRKIYVKIKASGGSYGDWLYYGSVSDNTSTTSTITSEPTDTTVFPDYDYIRKLYGNPFFESTPSRQLVYRSVDQLRLMFQGSFGSGSPWYWSDIHESRILVYPNPSSSLTLSFYFYKRPGPLSAELTSIPEIPIDLKDVLTAGVLWKGYEYRDRDGKQEKLANYEQLLKQFISRKGSTAKIPARVRDVIGDGDGWEY